MAKFSGQLAEAIFSTFAEMPSYAIDRILPANNTKAIVYPKPRGRPKQGNALNRNINLNNRRVIGGGNEEKESIDFSFEENKDFKRGFTQYCVCRVSCAAGKSSNAIWLFQEHGTVSD